MILKLKYYFNRNLSNVSESDTKANLREAFTASDEEKIMRVVDYPDIINRKQIDSLSIMTYLYQMRDYFENASNASNGEGDQSFVSQMEKEWENVEKSIKKLSIKQKKKQQDHQQQKSDNPFDDFDETEKENGNGKQSKVKTEDSKNPFNDQGKVVFFWSNKII